MSEQRSNQPRLTTRKAADKATRVDRVAAEMRKNLLKRKCQQQGKTADAECLTPSTGRSDDER